MTDDFTDTDDTFATDSSPAEQAFESNAETVRLAPLIESRREDGSAPETDADSHTTPLDSEPSTDSERGDGMVNPHTSDPFGPVILGLAVLVGSPALAPLVPAELVPTLMTTPLRRAVSAALLLVLISGMALWIVSRGSVRMAPPAAEGGDE